MSGIFDIITLRGLSARGHHGVYPFEREGTQPFTVDLSLWVDTRRAAAADDLDLTVDYGEIAGEAVAVLEGPSVYLLETLAQRIAEAALAHPRVHGVEVTLHKPMAPLRQQFSDVAITIRRGAAAEPASSAGASGESATRDEASAA
ncbi:dihydroneopterin aldolase, partial [Schaalia naturae]|uniref:dihydroneopterin aldolase n=1 Tax=Schaalia naturae TaxID=635203 RepID=UPI003632FA28